MTKKICMLLASHAVIAFLGLLGGLLPASPLLAVDPYGPANAKWTIVVMDPMAGPLACDCVKGYAQRKYEKLADYLQKSTGETVRVVWAESLQSAMDTHKVSNPSIVIGKDSVVRSDARKAKLDLQPIAQLTDMNGSVMQKGLFVVLQADKASSLLNLEGYKVLWGPKDCDEKSAAPRKMLKDLEIKTIDGNECASCSVAAKELVALGVEAKSVAVISSYAEPLLKGCGTIKEGDLRVVGSSDEVPFISAFIDAKLPSKSIQAMTTSLLEMKSQEMLAAMETKSGFLPYDSQKKSN